MALIKCKRCGQMISDKADKCPKCGCSVSVNEALDNVVVQNTPREKNNGISNKQISFVALVCLLVILLGGGIWWYLNSHEEIVKITPEFSEAVHKYDILCGFSEGMAAVRNPSNGKWGYINTEGKEVIPCLYDDAFPFSEGLASVKGENGKYGYIDKKGKTKVDFSFGYAESFSEGIAVTTNDLTWQFPRLTFINSKGNIIKELSNLNIRGWVDETDNLELGSFSNGAMGPCRFGSGDNDEVDWARDGGIYIDKYGNIIEDYAEDDSQKLNYEYEIVDDGIIDKAGKIVARYPASSGYQFPYESYYDGKDLHNVVDVRNGVILAMLHHHSDDRIGEVTIYGYVDLNGNETFTQDDYNRIAQAKKDEEERARQKEIKKREGTEIVITLHANRTGRNISSFTGNYGAKFVNDECLRTNKITVPTGKVWIFKKYELSGNLYQPHIADTRTFMYNYMGTTGDVIEQHSMFKKMGGETFFIDLALSYNKDTPVDLKVYFIEKDENYY